MADTATATDSPTSVEFAAWVRLIALHGRAMGLRVPAFRTPPRHPDPTVTRTLRRTPAGDTVVAVRLAGRTRREVLLDLLAGAVAAAGLPEGSNTAGEFRGRVVADAGVDVTPPPPRPADEED